MNLFLNQLVLGLQYLSQQLDIIRQRSFITHDGRIRFAPHPDRNHALIFAAPLQAVFPELRNPFTVRDEIPGVSINRILSADIFILLSITQARLMMRSSHDNAVFIRQFRISQARAIIIETG
ncbi:hypothetical protein D3C77_445080 [compost metagenome]